MAIHRVQIERFGGSLGLRDEGLLESALAQPPASFGHEFLHPGLVDMATAYLFHIVSNHPFVDGNKRTGLAAALVFLDINGVPIRHGTAELYALTMDVARSAIDKAAATERFRAIMER